MPDAKNLQKGVTLIELLIAITILTIGLLGIAGMQVTALKTNAKADTLSVASSLAEGVLEQFLARDPTDSLITTATSVPATWWTSQKVDGAGTYKATYTVTPNTPVNDISKISVTVSEVSGSNRSVTLTGYKKASAW